MKLVLATKNSGKLAELKSMFSGFADIEITSLLDYPQIPEVIEDGATFLENARKKALAVRDATGFYSLADDSGLVVRALGGGPGVMSARYAGKHGDYAANNRKLMEEMRSVPDGKRDAAFVCSMVLAAPDLPARRTLARQAGGREWDIEERCEGVIIREARGSGGFGYDPLFFVPNEGKTMAELPLERKNSLSHRGKALKKMQKILVEILRNKKETVF